MQRLIPSPYLNSVSTSGNWNWSFTETGYTGQYTKAVSGSSDILVAGEKNSSPQLLTATKFDSNGNKIWVVEIPSSVDVQPTDIIAYGDYGLLYGVSANGIHVAVVDASLPKHFNQ